MKLTITDVDYAPKELYNQIPFEIELLREIPGSDRPDYWIGKLTSELRWIKDNLEKKVTHVVIAPRYVGASIKPKIKNLVIGISYVTNIGILEENFLDFEKCEYVAIGVSNETGGDTQIKKIRLILSGIFDRMFKTRNKKTRHNTS